MGPIFLDPMFDKECSSFWPALSRNGKVPSSRSALIPARFTLLPMISQAFHSFEMIRITDGRCGLPALLRNSVLIRNNRSALRMALRARAMHTPARAAISAMVMAQVPRRLSTSSAMILSTASWPVVNRAAIWGGKGPDAARRRRRAIERCRSGDLGRR